MPVRGDLREVGEIHDAFTVSYSGFEKVIAYIQGRQEHHKKVSFEEEPVQFLQKHGIKYDKHYVTGG